MNDWALPPNRGMYSRLPKTNPNASFTDDWENRSALWAARYGLGEAADRYLGLYEPKVSHHSNSWLETLGIDELDGKTQGHLTHGQILKLGDEYVEWRQLSLEKLKTQIQSNTYEARQVLQSGQLKHYFKDLTLKQYARDTLWKANIHPVQSLWNGQKSNFCWNLGYTAGLGFMGFSIIQAGKASYHFWKAREDGSIGSQWRTAYETSKAAGKKSIQSLASWEAAGLGMAIGRALLPIGTIPVFGILMGGFLATSAYKAVGKWLSIKPPPKPGPLKS